MSDLSERFVNAIVELEGVADAVSADDAREQFDAPTLQAFWRDWPHISSWAGALWRKLNDEIDVAAKPATDEDEIGGEGGG